MARPLPFDGNHASQKFGRHLLMGVILLGLAALGMREADAQAKLEQTDVAIVATRDTQVGAQLAIADALGCAQNAGPDRRPRLVVR